LAGWGVSRRRRRNSSPGNNARAGSARCGYNAFRPPMFATLPRRQAKSCSRPLFDRHRHGDGARRRARRTPPPKWLKGVMNRPGPALVLPSGERRGLWRSGPAYGNIAESHGTCPADMEWSGEPPVARPQPVAKQNGRWWAADGGLRRTVAPDNADARPPLRSSRPPMPWCEPAGRT